MLYMMKYPTSDELRARSVRNGTDDSLYGEYQAIV